MTLARQKRRCGGSKRWLSRAKTGAALDVDRAFTHIQNAENRIKTTEVQVAASAAADNVTIVAYSVGRATAIDVQSAMRELKLAKEKQAEAVIDLLSAEKMTTSRLRVWSINW